MLDTEILDAQLLPKAGHPKKYDVIIDSFSWQQAGVLVPAF